MIPLLVGLAGATPPAADLQAAWDRVAAAVSAGARFPARPTAAALSTVAAGGVARRRLPDPSGDRALGIAWSPHGQEALWVSILDDKHFTLVDGLREEQLPGTTPQHKLLFQHLDLPWPLSDRQWVLSLRNNTALWSATGGAVWERYWTLAPPTLATHPDPEGLWLPACEGAWMLVDTAPGTLVLYQARTEIGGVVSPEVATRWALSTVESLLRSAIGRADAIGAHYDALHEPIATPSGEFVKPGGIPVKPPTGGSR